VLFVPGGGYTIRCVWLILGIKGQNYWLWHVTDGM